MIKAINNSGSIFLETSGKLPDQAQEFLAIRQFVQQNPEIEELANVIERHSIVEKLDFSSKEEAIQLHKDFSNSDHTQTTEEKIKEILGKKMMN
jgi:hypothetical protein|nr:MAG TPA: hypothetical protein [Caudoviricetes sp.]